MTTRTELLGPGLLCPIILFLILSASSTLGMDTHVDPETKRIRTLLGGLPLRGWGGWSDVFQYAMDDPRFDIRATIPQLGLDFPSIDLKFARRAARIYMPRNYESFLESTDLIVLANIDLRVFTPENIAWFRDSVLHEGRGCLMTGGSQGFGGYKGFPSWGDTVLDDILPVECLEGEHSKSYLPKLRIVDPENELARSIPWEEAPCFFPYNFIIPRPGCRVIIESDDDKRNALWFYWDIGTGRFVGCQNIFGVFGCDFMKWHYFLDSVLNTYYYTVAFPLPDDPLTIHELRRKWHEYRLHEKLLISLMEFADKFGANMRQVQDEMDAFRSVKKSSDQLYLDTDYTTSLRTIQKAISEAERIGNLAVKAKEKALFWVYLIEWLSVMATLIICGFAIWTLMVRRAVYREVQITRGGV